MHSEDLHLIDSDGQSIHERVELGDFSQYELIDSRARWVMPKLHDSIRTQSSLKMKIPKSWGCIRVWDEFWRQEKIGILLEDLSQYEGNFGRDLNLHLKKH